MNSDNPEEPQIFAVRKGGGNWVLSRRTFVTASTLATASLVVGAKSVNAQQCYAVAHRDGVTALTTNPDGALLISGGRDNAIRVWARIHVVAS